MKNKIFKNKNNCRCYFNESENKWFIESANGAMKFSSDNDHPFSNFTNVNDPTKSIKVFPGKLTFTDVDGCNGTFTILKFDENNIPIYSNQSDENIIAKFDNKWNIINQSSNEIILESNSNDEFALIGSWTNPSTNESVHPSISENWDELLPNNKTEEPELPDIYIGDGTFEMPYSWAQVADGESMTSEGLQMISTDTWKYVVVELAANTEYEFFASNSTGDSYLILMDENGNRLAETDEDDGDDVSRVRINYTPQTNGKYLLCYATWNTRGLSGSSSYCSYINATVSPSPMSKEEYTEFLANKALAVVDSSKTAPEILIIKNELNELSNLLAQIIEDKED